MRRRVSFKKKNIIVIKIIVYLSIFFFNFEKKYVNKINDARPPPDTSGTVRIVDNASRLERIFLPSPISLVCLNQNFERNNFLFSSFL